MPFHCTIILSKEVISGNCVSEWGLWPTVREDVWDGDHVSEKVLRLSQGHCAPHNMFNRAADIWEERREVGRKRDRKG